jgi:hypothetical protein
LEAAARDGKASLAVNLGSRQGYARLVRLRCEWDGPASEAPHLAMFSDNYFDLFPGEEKSVSLDFFLAGNPQAPLRGRLILEGSNVARQEIPLTLGGS